MIIDANVALRWFLNEPGAEAAAQCFAQGAQPLAPELVLAEIGNGLWKAVQKRRIDPSIAAIYLHRAPSLYGELRSLSALYVSAYEISVALNHPIYDCFYLALAEELRQPLLTTDFKLQSRTDGTRWRSLVSVLG
ncbi:MAG: type II toxin-antitoxin system VapC family toxin [Hyphomonadaceae bacterium]|nr:type II toxin-antitoxin system VapC family toxin [Hyphomonadaceae bacterium]